MSERLMSVLRPKPPEDPIGYQPLADGSTGDWLQASLDTVAGELEQRRRSLLGAAAIVHPERLLEDYNRIGQRADSGLYAILQAARRLRDAVDRVIVLGDPCGVLGPRAIVESCGHPCHNELSRGDRGGRPRISFVGSSLDNDAIQGLLDLVTPAGKPHSSDLLDQWGMIAADAAGSEPGTAAATRLFLAALLEAVGGMPASLADRFVPIARLTGGPTIRATSPASSGGFAIPDGTSAGAAVFTPLGLLPAAVAGIDVVRLLQGAAAMNRRFREAPAATNPVLQFAGVSRLMAEQGCTARVLASRSSQLDSVVRWHGQCMARRGRPLTTNLVALEPRRDALIVPAQIACEADADGIDHLVGRPWSDLVATIPGAASGEPSGATFGAARGDHDRMQQPEDTILLPRVDEHAVGQLLQFCILTDLMEPRG